VTLFRGTTTLMRVTVTVSTGLALAVGGAGLAIAKTGAATTTVNVRSAPNTSSTIKGSLARGQRITVVGKTSSRWARVSFGGSRAYIASKYLDTSGSLPAAPRKISAGSKVATETLNIRTGPSTSYRIVGSLREGSRITVTGKQQGGFAQTRYAGHTRWVAVTYLAKAKGGVGTKAKSSKSTSSTSKSSKSKSKSSKSRSSVPRTSAAKGRAALAFAKRQLGKRYVWGAEGPNTYDCSGLVMRAWRSVGVSMPRVARQQYAQGHKISRSRLRAGDLVFFYSQTPHHVGIYVGNGRLIDAPRPGKRVRYTTIGHMPYSGAVRPG
jgi:cell wall-associated NlpC family hydrolase